MKTLTYLSCLTCVCALAVARQAPSLHFIPTHARAGHLVKEFTHKLPNTAKLVGDPNISKYFALVNSKVLITTADIKHLTGKVVQIGIQELPGSITDYVNIHVHDAAPKLNFDQQPYNGYIEENQEPGSEVKGLENFVESYRKFPYGCKLSITSGDSEYFSLQPVPMVSVSVVSKAMFDREAKPYYNFNVKASCPDGEALTIIKVDILDQNDNVPVMERAVYDITIPYDTKTSAHVITVQARDGDYGDTLKYKISDPSLAFGIKSDLGKIYVKNPDLLHAKTYEIIVWAMDSALHQSEFAIVRVEVMENPSNGIFHRSRRSLRDERTYVTPETQEGNLFYVFDIENTVDGDRFYFMDPAPEDLVLNAVSGMLSRGPGHQWNTSVEEVMFTVNVTNIETGEEDEQPIKIKLVNRPIDFHLFNNLPRPMWSTVPTWIRPHTVIYTVDSVDKNDCEVRYKIESGSDDRFYINAITGDVMIKGRAPFEPNGHVYTMGISAQCVGMAPINEETPSQALRVQVGDKEPQIYQIPYVVNMKETTAGGAEVETVMAKSFQDLPMTFTFVPKNDLSQNRFTLTTGGVLRLNNALEHIRDPAQYRYTLTVTEQYSNYVSTAELIVNLVGENLYTPSFGPDVYTAVEVWESETGNILEITGIDLDKGDNGRLTFVPEENSFMVESTGDKMGQLKAASDGSLDYDFIEDHRYEFTLTATDHGDPTKSGSCSVQVFMKNVNDEAPVFSPQNQTIRIKQGARQNTLVHVVQAYDPDGDGISFRFLDNTDLLEVDSSTGFIRLRRDVGASEVNEDIRIEARDDSSCCPNAPGNTQHTTEGHIIVEFIGVNHPPRFPDCGTYNPTIKEGEPAPLSVINITAVDDDSGTNGELTYSVVVEDHIFDRRFEVRDVNGRAEVYTLQEFNREEPFKEASWVWQNNGGNNLREQKYRVTVKAEDNGKIKLSTNCFFFVTIEDVNDNPPRFDESTYEATILKSLAVGERIVEVFAVDDDAGLNAEVEYSIDEQDNDCPNCVAIDTDGWIRVNNAIPAQLNEFTVKVKAEDKGTPPLSNIVDVHITLVSDAKDLPPTWQITDYTVSADENSGGTIKEFEASTNDPAARVVYYLPAGRTPMENSETDFFFRTTATNLMDIIRSKLDYERVNQYRLKLSAAYNTQQNLANKQRITVNIIDLNDIAPKFEGLDLNGRYPAAVTEETNIGDDVITVVAVDLDGTSPNNLVRYYFDDNCGDCSAFNLDQTTGRITATQEFDRNIQASFSLTVHAYDGAPSSITPGDEPNDVSTTIVVDVTGASRFPPYFAQGDYQVPNYPEGPILGSEIVTVSVIDPDPEFNYVQYSISDGNAARKFNVEQSTGKVYTVGSIYFDDQPAYTLTVQIFDGSVINTTTVNLGLKARNVHPPVFDDFTVAGDIEEKDTSITTSNPRLLATISASDPDASRGGDIQYSLAGELMSQGFEIRNGNQVYLTNGLSRDYPEGYDEWQINVVATDEIGAPESDPKNGYQVLKLKLEDKNDNAPVFDVCCVDLSVDEGSNIGTDVMPAVTVTDVDSGIRGVDGILYTLIESPKNDADNDIFRMPSQSDGQIEVALNNELDILVTPKYDAKVMARDNDGNDPTFTTETDISITVNDINNHRPEFDSPSYTLVLPENMPIGSSIFEFNAEDLDTNTVDNAKHTYEITSGGQDKFYVDSIFMARAGVVKINEVLDYDNGDRNFEIQIKVEDNNPSQTATATLTITLTDVNDNAPIFNPSEYTAMFPENAEIGRTVTTVTATDPDEGENAVFDYFMDYANTDQKQQFAVDASSGVVTVNKALDRETEGVHTLHVLAIDKGEPPMTGTATVVVTLEDINDNPPEPRENYDTLLSRSPGMGALVVAIYAMDPDTEANGPPFTIEAECNEAWCNDFTYNQRGSGADSYLEIVTAKATYDRSDLGRNEYNIPIRMTDDPVSQQPPQSAVYTITITIEGDNYNPPQASTKDVLAFNYNRQFKDASFGRVWVNDPVDDGWDEEDMTYNFVGDADGFSLDPNTGVITMDEGCPQGAYTLQVNVKDSTHNVEVVSTVNVQVNYIGDDAVQSSGSMRIAGRRQDFIRRPRNAEGVESDSKAELFRAKMAELMGAETQNVWVFSIMNNTEDGEEVTDVTFTAHGSPYYRSSRLIGTVITNKQTIENDVGITILRTPIDDCLYENCYDGGCHNRIVAQPQPSELSVGSASFVGVTTGYEATCSCGAPPTMQTPTCEETSCMNGGTCVENWGGISCECDEGYDGPRCQQLKHSFSGSGYAWFEPPSPCLDGKFSIEFMTNSADALILYNGPMTDIDTNVDVRDFMSLELRSGYARGMVDLGDGSVTLDVTGGSRLDDGTWHTLELFKEHKTIRLVVDHCESQIIDENINETSSDRSTCEAIATVPGTHFLLNVVTPLEVGGRSNPGVNYPTGLTTQGLTGCVKNMEADGWIYDLHIGDRGHSVNSADGCPDEATNCDGKCPTNSTCIGSLAAEAAVTCVCYAGLRGSNCDIETTIQDFLQPSSFIEWDLGSGFDNDTEKFEFQAMFTTRKPTGTIFEASSFSTLERVRLEVIDTILTFRYDLGNDDIIVSLPYVNVSDGVQHTVRIHRYANQVILRLDGGEGKYYGESYPSDNFRQIGINEKLLYGAAQVSYNKHRPDFPNTVNALYDSCMTDFRFNKEYFPFAMDENSELPLADVVELVDTEEGCETDACAGVNCPPPQICYDYWRMPYCGCEFGYAVAPAPDFCVLITDCSIPRCANGDCVTIDGSWRCNCWEGYTGDICDIRIGELQGNVATLSAGAIGSIVGCLIAALLLLLLVILFTRNKKQSELLVDVDNYDTGRVMEYSEEGAGEEDMHNYDLSRLQKPVDPHRMDPHNIHTARNVVEEMPRLAPEPMHAERKPFTPGDSNIGDFVDDRLRDADYDPNAPPYDSLRQYEYEGEGSTAGSLSTLNSSSSGDLDFDYLNDFGPRFKKLADMYGAGADNEDESNV